MAVVASEHFVPAIFDPTPYLPVKADPIVAKLVADVNEARIKAHIERLADFFTRNSVSTGAVDAAKYLEGLMSGFGCQNARQSPFRAGYGPNVMCEVAGSDTSLPAVLVGGHFDSRSTGVSDPNQRAPGADDNGSGSAAILDLIENAVELKKQLNFEFKRTIIFVLFCGEEQGLVGSAALASEMRRGGTQLAAMVNLDMIGFPQPNAPATLYWMSGSTNRPLTDLAFSLTREYLGPETVLQLTGACCSDQQSFHSQGYVAASIFESLSAFNNPNYHRSSDTPSTVTYSHVRRNAQSAVALIATLAEPTPKSHL